MTFRPLALAATLSLTLAACADEETAQVDSLAGDTSIIIEDNDSPRDMAADMPAADMAPANDGDAVSISRDGVQATVNDGDTKVTVDGDGDPGVNIQID